MTTQTGQRLDRTVFFGSADLQGAGMVLSGANLSCVFGSVRGDLRAAELAAQEVTLECFILFGSLELRVPASWRVMMDVRPLFGSADERGLPPTLEAGAPTLRVSGTVIFGSVELERF
jgi:hypothetical protein